MEFFIRRDSLEPVLKMQLILDGRHDFQTFHTEVANSSVYFSMKDVETGVLKIANKPGGIVAKTPTSPNAPTEYYIYYQWTTSDVKREGRYEGQFMIQLHGIPSELVAPIREDLFINISNTFTKSTC